ncbi:MAG TPA: metalloregulator ArsR/SmtB family transcription factor [Phycisphaerae bacterium]|nr:metalloregulator ArsR/SmtB family transcription factor [Phycisphaerae bacterium]
MDATSFTPAAAQPELFRALAEPTRQRLVQILLSEELSVTELITVLRLPQSTISRHLKVLRAADLVRDRREGVTTYYTAAPLDDVDDLRGAIHRWLARRPLPQPLVTRLQRVLRRRDDGAAGFFQRIGKRWDELREAAFGEAFATEAFAALLPREWTVADIGTGTGFLLPILADNFDRVIAVEPAATMLECARQRGAECGATNIDFHAGDLDRLPIEDHTCDLTIACLVLHHVPEPGRALAEMHRVVKPGGRILVIEQRAHENQAFYEMMQDRWWGFERGDLARQVAAVGFGDVRHHDLRMVQAKSGAIDSPGLFVLTACRAGSTRR